MAKTKMTYQEAAVAAFELCKEIEPHCERIGIAGSIRRGKSEIGDLEIVVIPGPGIAEQDLFGEKVGERLTLMDWIEQNAERIVKNGPKYKQFIWRGKQVDLFLTTREQWGIIFLIRTGSAEFSKKIMTSQVYGGYMPVGMKVADGRLMNGDGPIPTPEEEDVFVALGLDYIQPEDRS